MKKQLTVMMLVILLISMMTFVDHIQSAKAAATLNVGPGSTYTTIQAAVNAANPGDTINVAAGVYDGQVVITKSLTLQGAGSDFTGTVLQCTISPTIVHGSPYDYKPVVIIGASGVDGSPVLLKDIMIRPRQDVVTSGQLAGILLQPNSTISYFELDNVHIIGTRSAGTAEAGLVVDDNTNLNHFVVKNCEFNDMAYGMIFYKNINNPTIVQNIEVNNTVFDNNSIKGFYAEKLSDATFNTVTVTNNGNTTLSPDWADPNNAGIDINLKFGAYQNLVFNGLTVTGNGIGSTNGVGLSVKARGTGNDPSYSSNPATLIGVTVNGGTLTGNAAGIRFGEPGKNNISPTTITVNNAAIYGNTQFGLSTALSGITVVAERNYWGSGYPNFATINFGNVDFSPYYSDFAKTTLKNITVKSGGSIGTDCSFTTIQSAIDAASSGDTINALAGTYNENLNISKQVSLTGPNVGINPNTGTRLAEAVITGTVTAVTIASDSVALDGFTVTNPSGNWHPCEKSQQCCIDKQHY